MTNISYIKNKLFVYNFNTYVPYIKANFYFNVSNVVSIELGTEVGMGEWDGTKFVWPMYYFKILTILDKSEEKQLTHQRYADLYNLYDPTFDIKSLKLP